VAGKRNAARSTEPRAAKPFPPTADDRPRLLNVGEAEPPTSDVAVTVYPPALSMCRFGKVAIPDWFVVAVSPEML
jgi:hypothetical protein